MTLILLGTISRHLTYLLDPITLQTKLRRSMGNPYISFIFILVSDCISLLLSFSALVAWPQANIATMATIFDVTFNMFHLRSFYQLLGQVHESFFETSIPPLAITMMISGMLYYTTLLKGAIYFKEFKRTDDDFLAIAGSHAVLGRFADALNFLKSIKNPSFKSNAIAAPAYLAVNQTETAWGIAKALSQEKSLVENNDSPFQVLANSSLIYPIPKNILLSLIKCGIDKRVTDSNLLCAANALIEMSQIETDKILGLLDGKQATYPLTYSWQMIRVRNLQDAKLILERMTPKGECDEVIRSLLMLAATISNPDTTWKEDKEEFEQWAENHLSKMYRPRFVGHSVDGIPSHAASSSKPSFSARTWAGVL